MGIIISKCIKIQTHIHVLVATIREKRSTILCECYAICILQIDFLKYAIKPLKNILLTICFDKEKVSIIAFTSFKEMLS